MKFIFLKTIAGKTIALRTTDILAVYQSTKDEDCIKVKTSTEKWRIDSNYHSMVKILTEIEEAEQ